MAGVLEEDPLHVAQPCGRPLDDPRADLVVAARHEQHGHVDLAEPVGDVPVPQRPLDPELRGAVHGRVDRRVVGDRVVRAHELVGPGVQAADEPRGELLGGRDVGRRGRPAGRLLGVQDPPHGLRQRRPQLRAAGGEVAHRRGRVGGDQRQQAGRAAQRVGEAEHPAPGVADEVVAAVDAEVLQERLELGGEEVDRPERGSASGRCSLRPLPTWSYRTQARPGRLSPAIGAT